MKDTQKIQEIFRSTRIPLHQRHQRISKKAKIQYFSDPGKGGCPTVPDPWI